METKFRITINGKDIGRERLTAHGWEWMLFELNPVNGERWVPGLPADNGHEIIRDQFTGLHDRLGKEIYEGDIVKLQSYSFHHIEKYNYEVYYDAKSARFKFRNNVPFPRNQEEDANGNHSFEVIGNIHEHPHLIEQL